MEVILSKIKNRPSCPHGPCLLFERYSSDNQLSGKKFFACSACRNRSECNFFQWADDEISEKKKKHWEKIREVSKPPLSHEEYQKRLEIFKSLPADKKMYCRTCSLLILEENKKHLDHDILENISLQHLLQPSLLFDVHENKKVEAQYFFTESTTQFLVTILKDLGFTKLVSLGVPKIHEYIIKNENCGLTSLLMDIDFRYMQFFGMEQFCHFNMFNNYFFNGKESKKVFKKFLSEKQDEKLVILLDPPFGGMIDAISHTLKIINKWWQEKNENSDKNVPIIWFFPYFHEARILKNFPDMKMMDYKVEYQNHKKFKNIKSKKSPVRIFTNIQASDFALPAEDGYKFCAKCQRYVSEENQHCSKCNSCTTKHGKTFKHCDICKQCVKSSFIHCKNCNKCALPSLTNTHLCQDCQCSSSENNKVPLQKCFRCNEIGHRKQNCPVNPFRLNKRRKQKK